MSQSRPPFLRPAADPLARAETLRRSGQTEAAAELLRAVLLRNPRDGGARRALAALGQAARPQPRLEAADRKALRQIEKAVSKNAWSEVAAKAPALLRRYPQLGDLANALGSALAAQGKVNDALRVFDHALRHDPALPDTYANLSTLLRQSGQAGASLEAARAGLDVAPDNALLHLAEGLALFDLDAVEEAASALHTATRNDPTLVLAWDALARVLERLNQLDALDAALKDADAACPDAPVLALHHAAASLRRSDAKAALAELTDLPADTLPPFHRTRLHELRGKAHDRLGEASAAFAAFTRMNASKSLNATRDPDAFLTMVEAKLDGAPALSLKDWGGVDTDGTAPIFMVGFPRSGTTLLDTILRAAPRLSIVEEQPLVETLTQAIPPDNEARALSALSSAQIAARRASYRKAFDHACPATGADRIMVDKLPLNLLQAASIARHFPDARFVLSLRHPADAVLSGFMQNFRSNPAMDVFLTLDGSARLYDLSMRYFQMCRDALGLDVVEIRYEDLVRDVQASVTPVLDRLGLAWTDAMLDHTTTARNRTAIRTPSYSQVSQPIYTDASGRWTRYREHLAPVMETLTPWIDRWGYDA